MKGEVEVRPVVALLTIYCCTLTRGNPHRFYGLLVRTLFRLSKFDRLERTPLRKFCPIDLFVHAIVLGFPGFATTANLEYWEKTARMILEVSTTNKIVVEKSTLPVKTADAMERILNDKKSGRQL